MDPYRLRRLIVAIVAMLAATLVYGTLSLNRPFGISAATADVIGLSLLVVPVVFFGSLVTVQFPFEEYQTERGIGGIVFDGVVIFIGCLIAAIPAAYAATVLDLGGTGRMILVGAVAYFAGFGVFTVRNLPFYVPKDA